MQVSKSHRFATLLTAAATIFAVQFPTTEAAEMTLNVTESQIVSLANSPALLAFDQFVDEAEKPWLRLEMEFANECYAGVGADMQLWRRQARQSGAILVVSQRVPPEGCPDIFQPVRRSLGVILPLELSGQSLYLVARPAPETAIRTVLLRGIQRERYQENELSNLITSSRVVPALQSPSIAATEANGYILTGKLQVTQVCQDGDLRAQVFEVPDESGMPRNDAVLLTVPAECAAAEASTETDIVMRVDTPQPRRGRTVTLLNAAPPTPIQLPD